MLPGELGRREGEQMDGGRSGKKGLLGVPCMKPKPPYSRWANTPQALLPSPFAKSRRLSGPNRLATVFEVAELQARQDLEDATEMAESHRPTLYTVH